jgi:hypothetical protein
LRKRAVEARRQQPVIIIILIVLIIVIIIIVVIIVIVIDVSITHHHLITTLALNSTSLASGEDMMVTPAKHKHESITRQRTAVAELNAVAVAVLLATEANRLAEGERTHTPASTHLQRPLGGKVQLALQQRRNQRERLRGWG